MPDSQHSLLTAPVILGVRQIAAGSMRLTRLEASGFDERLWSQHSDRPRCKATVNEFCQCDFEEHGGDEHEYTVVSAFTRCAACGGEQEWSSEHECTVIVHMVDCPKFEGDEGDDD